MIVVLASLLVATPLEVSTRPGLGAQEISATLQMGAGQIEGEAAALALPRAAYRNHYVDIGLRAPLFMRFADSSLVHDITDATTYVGVVDNIEIGRLESPVRLKLGGLVRERLGVGVLVDGYTNRMGPLSLDAGGRLHVQAGGVAATAMVGNVLRGNVLAARVALQPLMWADVVQGDRVTLAFEGAFDPRAPDDVGTTWAGGGALTLDAAAWRGQNVGVGVFAALGALHGGALGQHMGLRTEALFDERGQSAVVLEVSGIHKGQDYTPHYFDRVYDAERTGIGQTVTPKRTWRQEAGWEGELSLLGRARFVQFGLTARSDLRTRSWGEAFVEVQDDDYRVSTLLVQRDMQRPEDLWAHGARTVAVLDASYSLWAGFFAFGSIWHGFRSEAAAPARVVSDWMLGVGYGAEDDLSS